jgi:hypothetical protein
MSNAETTGAVEHPGEHRLADQMVPRVSTLIAKGALLQERRLQVSENGEVRWVGPDPQAEPTSA